MNIFLYVTVVTVAVALPSRWRKNVAENTVLDSFDNNYFPKFAGEPEIDFNSFDNLDPNSKDVESIDSHIQSIPKTKSTSTKETVTTTTTTSKPQTTKVRTSLILNVNATKNDTNKPSRQEEEFGEKSKEKESQEDDESSEEEPNMLTGLLSAFLGGLSRPDGSIDLEAILGLLGSLSTQNPDGSYDFSGLTELLRSFFGGGGEGGSDVGAFAGGLVGAILKGLAAPPGGAKGVGIFTGRILGGILPALSGPPPSEGDSTTLKPPPLDSGGFASGLLKSIFQSSAGNVSKFSLIKSAIGLLTSLSKTSSSLSFGGPTDWNRPPPPPPPAR